MELGVFVQAATVEDTAAAVRQVVDRGVRSIWMPQIFGIDALTTIGAISREFPGVRFGTAVVPTYPRHPLVMAAQARTVQQISGGALTLGIGLSHQIVIESMLGMSFDRPVRHMREYLDILLPLVRDGAADAAGETLTYHGPLEVTSEPVPVVVAALGAQMLRLCGSRTEGTVTWMTGPRTVESHVAPTLAAAAADAGRPEPRVVMALPVAVTDDPDGAREKAAATFAMYGILPSYRAMLDREGVEGPADVAIVGDEATVRAGIDAAFSAGATEFVVVPFTERERTLEVVQSLL